MCGLWRSSVPQAKSSGLDCPPNPLLQRRSSPRNWVMSHGCTRTSLLTWKRSSRAADRGTRRNGGNPRLQRPDRGESSSHSVREVLKRVEAASGKTNAALSAVTAVELRHGIYRAKKAADRKHRKTFVQELCQAVAGASADAGNGATGP